MVGPVVWDVTWGGAVVWTSPPFAVSCETTVDEVVTTPSIPLTPADTPPPDDTTFAIPPLPPADDPAVGPELDTPLATPLERALQTPVVEPNHTGTVAPQPPPVTLASPPFPSRWRRGGANVCRMLGG